MQDIVEATQKYGVFMPLGVMKEFAEDLGEALKIASQGGNPDREAVVEQVAKSRWARNLAAAMCGVSRGTVNECVLQVSRTVATGLVR